MSFVARTRNKKSKLTLGSEALHGLLENGKTPLSQQFLRWKLWRKWDEFVGKSMAEISEPVGFMRGNLYIWVKNAAWMQQMVFMRDPLKQKINEKLGMDFVRNIHLTQDKKSVPRDPEEARELKAALGKLIGDNLED